MKFYVEWADGTFMWIPHQNDITNTCAFDIFCTERREIQYLLVPLKAIPTSKRQLNALDIIIVKPKDTVYVNLRFYGHQWFELLALPDWE